MEANSSDDDCGGEFKDRKPYDREKHGGNKGLVGAEKKVGRVMGDGGALNGINRKSWKEETALFA